MKKKERIKMKKVTAAFSRMVEVLQQDEYKKGSAEDILSEILISFMLVGETPVPRTALLAIVGPMPTTGWELVRSKYIEGTEEGGYILGPKGINFLKGD